MGGFLDFPDFDAISGFERARGSLYTRSYWLGILTIIRTFAVPALKA